MNQPPAQSPRLQPQEQSMQQAPTDETRFVTLMHRALQLVR
jgi:hypothetical protein